MPSRSLPPPPPPSPVLPSNSFPPIPSQSSYAHHRSSSSHLVPSVAGATAACSLILLLITLFRKITRKRTTPTDSKPPHRFSYSDLQRATSSFSPSHRLGQGGFGPVFRGSFLPTFESIAVKVMDHGSLQGEREFHNELFFAAMLDSPHILSVLGFCSRPKRHRMLLVYNLMCNGNLQDALLYRKCVELMEWKMRFSIALDIAKGIAYLHGLETPVIHGDIKPSNILLDQYFSAKISDFGLARLKSENQCEVTIVESDVADISGGLERKKGELERNCRVGNEDYGSVAEETESVTTFFDESNVGVDQSPDSFARAPISPTSPKAVTLSEVVMVEALPEGCEKGSIQDGSFDKVSVESGKEVVGGGKRSGRGIRNNLGKDWWWKQDDGTTEVKRDYVMEWIGMEIKKGRPNGNQILASSTGTGTTEKKETKKKRNRKRLEWWKSLDEESCPKIEKRRPAREWWKEEYCDELAKEKKKKKKRQLAMNGDENGGENRWSQDEDMYSEGKKKSRRRSRSRGSRGSVDWWLDGLSGDLWRGRNNSKDSVSGEIPKSGGISSTPSMRGTVCYVAPEYGGAGDLSEKCDVYSYGVLLLVLIAGRRPLQVTGSPMSEFHRANLLSWARHLARAGKLLDLVDQSLQSLDKEQAHLCITLALLCLQKSPACRPSMEDVVGMLTGVTDVPPLPFECSPSPPSHFKFKSQKKAR